MLRNKWSNISQPSNKDLSASPNLEVERILLFIDQYLPSFPDYYKSVKDSERENRISDILVHHLQLCKTEYNGGLIPFDFRKNPTQPHSSKETDIGVFTLSRDKQLRPIIEFEAKRFSQYSNNKEYVCGIRGGIERFKRGDHSSQLKTCGMFAYIQKPTTETWINKVNTWISELSLNNADATIDWTNQKEILKKVQTFQGIEKLSSSHSRKKLKDFISLWHYFIDLN